MARQRLVLLHGVATTGVVWQPVVAELGALGLNNRFDISAPDRPATGRLDDELAWLAPLAEDAWVVGFSGGATLGLALAARGLRMHGAVLHEPAVGSLVPGLLGPAAEAFRNDGYAGFGHALYGSGWNPAMAPEDGNTVARELPMFRAFEPGPPSPAAGRVVVSVGEFSPVLRQRASLELQRRWRLEQAVVPHSSHFAPHDHPSEFARMVSAILSE